MKRVSISIRIPGYEIRGILGQGGMSTVYEGTQDGKSFAIKVFKASLHGAAAVSNLSFRKEGAALARLDHPGVVRVIEVGEAEDHPFLVMERVEGESLSSLLRNGPLSAARVVELAKSLASWDLAGFFGNDPKVTGPRSFRSLQECIPVAAGSQESRPI